MCNCKVMISVLISLVTFNNAKAQSQQTIDVSSDFIYENKGEYLVNPNYVRVIRRVNLNSTKNLLNRLNDIEHQYNRQCRNRNSEKPIKSSKIGYYWISNSNLAMKQETTAGTTSLAPCLK